MDFVDDDDIDDDDDDDDGGGDGGGGGGGDDDDDDDDDCGGDGSCDVGNSPCEKELAGGGGGKIHCTAGSISHRRLGKCDYI
jgi:hypothetical protein